MKIIRYRDKKRDKIHPGFQKSQGWTFSNKVELK